MKKIEMFLFIIMISSVDNKDKPNIQCNNSSNNSNSEKTS